MNRSGRLPRTVKSQFHKRRLDMVTEKNEMIQDIMQLAGDSDMEAMQSELCEFGDSLSEVLPKLSLPRIRRVHSRVVLGTMDIPFVEEF